MDQQEVEDIIFPEDFVKKQLSFLTKNNDLPNLYQKEAWEI
jgi:hypothetical protein